MNAPAVETAVSIAIGLLAGVGLRRLTELRRPRPRPQLYRLDLAVVTELLAALMEAKRMKVNVAVGAQMSREAWEVVTVKLLDLVGGGMDGRERDAVGRFVQRALRAWPDLEQRARDENPGAPPPAAPIG